MEGPLKELAKLEKLTDKGSAKGKSSISDSLDSLLQSLHEVKDRLEADTGTQDTFGQLAVTVEARKKEVEDKQKEIYSSLSRFGKALDKVCAEHHWRKLPSHLLRRNSQIHCRRMHHYSRPGPRFQNLNDLSLSISCELVNLRLQKLSYRFVSLAPNITLIVRIL
jgi:hypothetical protein